MNGLHRLLQVTLNECQMALRSRRALVVMILSLAAALLSMNVTITSLSKMETQLAEVLQLPVDARSGVVSTTLWRSKSFQKIVRHGVRDSLIYDDICGRHPVELLHAFFSFLFMPILTILAAGNRIADDLHTGAVRYMLTRVTRFEWSLGKYLGFALLLLPALLLGGCAAWGLAAFRLGGHDVGNLLPAMLGWSVKAWILTLSYLGLALGASHLTVSGAKATTFGIVALVTVHAGPALITRLTPEQFHLVNNLFPTQITDALWRTTWEPVTWAVLWSFALGLLYLTVGYAFFARKDAR